MDAIENDGAITLGGFSVKQLASRRDKQLCMDRCTTAERTSAAALATD
jgi:hypothetical protein